MLFAMNTIFTWVGCGVAAYLLGSIPFGYLLAYLKGYNIRTLGSGNIGATNVFRSVSKPLGVLTFILDMLKGVAAVLLIPLLAMLISSSEPNSGLPLFTGAMSVAGHNWSCFLGFKGGKGVATSAGMLLALTPVATGIALCTWVVIFLLFRYVSLASIVAALVLGGATWFIDQPERGIWFSATLTLLSLLAVWRHRANIVRLWNGSELRFGRG